MPVSGLRALAAVVSLLVLGACASSDGDVAGEETAPGDPAVATDQVVARDVPASEIARELGLRVVPGADRVILEPVGSGPRILLFPGSRVATVGARMLDLGAPVTFSSGEAWVAAEDVSSIRTTWRTETSAGGSLPSRTAGARVPIPDGPRAPGAAPPRPSSVPAASADNRPTPAEVAAWSVPLRRKWQYIVVHHSASAVGSAAQIHEWHRDRGFDGLGYNFVIGNGTGSPDGAIEVGYRWKQQLVGAHARTSASDNRMNEVGIGICLVGDFTRTRPSAAQMRALDRLCTFLAQYCGLPPTALRLHGDLKSTECPGKLFPRDFAIRLPRSGSRTAGAPDGGR